MELTGGGKQVIVFSRVLLLLLACAVLPGLSAEPAHVPWYGFAVVNVYPHSRRAFTQGLEFRNGVLYESTGLEGRSSLRKEELESGKLLHEIDLPPQYFGEGITVLGARIVQITWQTHAGFIYDRSSFTLLKQFTYPGEGWGLTNDGRHIYFSDGSSQIRCLNGETLKEERRISVHEGGRAIDQLNELEWVRGEIFANVWQTDRIARISPVDGRILGWIDLAGLLPKEDKAQDTDVLNGIAYDSQHGRLFVTGKLWPKLFEIRLVRQDAAAGRGD